ncbi:MAG: CRISPR-associated endonuclease Cas1 [Bacteroidetes bacterium]|nr:CRISPR-associated endonuclease Cas1 [Bacteroidota bacterium]
MDISFIKNIDYQIYHVRLKFTDHARFTYFHGAKLNGILSSTLEKHPIGNVVINAVESGRIHYSTGEYYNFVVTHFGDEDEFKPLFEEKFINKFSDDILEDIPGFWFRVVEYKDVTEAYKSLYATTEDYNNISFITPLRMSRSNPTKGKSLFDMEVFELDRFFRLLYSRVYDLAKSLGINVGVFQAPELPDVKLTSKRVIWVDTIFNKIFGGIIGNLQYEGELSDEWKELLRFGLLTHAGNNTALGFGKYTLGKYFYESQPVMPNRTFLEDAIEPNNLLTAFKEIRQNRGQAGTDGINLDIYEKSLLENLGILNKEIDSSEYKPSLLKGIILPKGEGKIRALAIPTVKERILQRGAVQVLNDTVEALFEDNSYAYRKGYSRRGAATAISKAYAEGYHYVLEADINSFFDNVDWAILFEKLDIIFRYDPIVMLLKKWVMADVEYDGRIIQRKRGLPQGAVISPMLANLFLDELDDTLGNDFKLIRYADDFVVLCKSEKEALKAKDKAEQVLHSLNLEFKDEKTGIRDFDSGFKYLGYLFVRSLVMQPDNKNQTKPLRTVLPEEDFEVPLNSWITDALVKKIPASEGSKKEPIITPLFTDEENKKYPVYLTSHEPAIFTSQDRLAVKYPEDADRSISYPLKEISFVVVIGVSKISLQSVLRLKEEGIPVYLCHRNGSIRESFEAGRSDYLLWFNQAELQKNEAFIIEFTREIVSAKIHNQRVLALRYEWEADVIEEFKLLERHCKIYNSIDSIRGVEGRAAALFFEHYSNEIPLEWGFTGRKKNPPPDPINAMLSYGYSILYYNISTALIMSGLNPSIGWFHVPGNYNALASDIQEEFRHIIERLVIYLIKRKIITRESFSYNKEAKYPYLLKSDARKEFIKQVEQRLLTDFKLKDKDGLQNYRTYFYRKARSIATMCRNKETQYESFRIR